MDIWLTIEIIVADMTSGILSMKYYYQSNEASFIKY